MAVNGKTGGNGGRGRLRIVLALAAGAGGIAAGLRFSDGDTAGALAMIGVAALFLLALFLTYRA